MLMLPCRVGHKATALVRNETSLSSFATDDGSLKIVKGQPQDHADVEKAFTAVPDDMPIAVLWLPKYRELAPE